MKKNYCILFFSFTTLFFAQDYKVSSIPENLLSNANAVIRESSEDHVIKSVNEMEIKQSAAITILNAAGDSFSTVYIPYDPTTRVSNIKVELYDEFGKLFKTFSKKDFSDFTNNPSSGLYVDNRVLILRPIILTR